MTALSIDAASAHWAPQRRLSLQQARARSQFLRFWRTLCVVVAASAVGSIIAVMALHGLGGGFTFNRRVAEAEALTMIAPRFTGRTKQGQPYQITARTAVRRGPAADQIDLDSPRYEGGDGEVITALKGVYEPQAQRIELTGDVVYQDPDERSFLTSHAFVDAAADIVQGTAPIEGRSRLGEVRADAYELRQEDGRLIMKGRVRGVIEDRPEAN